MDDKEKVSWLQAVVIMWSPSVFFNFMAAVFSNGDAGYDVILVNAWVTVAPLALYLLILSWRTAYLSGRKKR